MKRRILSIALALCLCVTTVETTFGLESIEDGSPAQQETAPEGAPAAETVSGSAISGDAGNNQQGTTSGNGSAEGPTSKEEDSTIPTQSQAYQAMIAFKSQDQFKEGDTWTNDVPYSGTGYRWNGGPLNGANISAVGCVAFAFILSDAAFGSMQAGMYAKGEFKFEDIKVGDILRVNNDAHTVIVLEVNDAGVVVAEGNYNGKVHWGRAISKETVMSDTNHYITRYPTGYVSQDDPDANKSIAQGNLEPGLAWNLTKAGILTISGKGAMQDFSGAEKQPWNKYSSQIRKVVIKDGVTSIGSCAFLGCVALSAEIPSSVTAIGNSAFQESSIISVAIPSSVKTIGDNAFFNCQNLNSALVSEGVETIGQTAFRACVSLKSIDLPASVGEVGAAAFMECTEITSVKFSAGSKQVMLGDNLFTQCYKLASVTLPQNINCISKEMFQNCLMLTRVEIPQGVESIGESAFTSCSFLKTVVIPDSVTEINRSAFTPCYLTDIYFTGTEAQWHSIRKMGDTASALSNVTIHYNYTPPVDPGNNTGGSNTGSSGTNPGSGSNTGSSGNAGSSNSSGNSGNPGSGSNAGNHSGGNTGDPSGSNTGGGSDSNTGDPSGSNTGGNPGNNDNSGNNESQEPEQAPFEKGETFEINKGTYKVTKAGKEVKLVMPESTAEKVTVNTITGTDGVKYKVTSIGAKAMQNNKKLKSLTIGANVKTIGANAFSGCTKLKTVTFGKNVTAIGANAFKGCRELNEVTIRSTKLHSVGKQAFKGTKSGLKVKVPSKQLNKYKKIFKKAGLKARQIIK